MENALTSLPPFKLIPYYKNVIWGGERIAAFKNIPSQSHTIGESWEVSALPGSESVVAEGPDKGLTLTRLIERYGASLVGTELAGRPAAEFPLLIKFIDARSDLSVQVHPDDEMARHKHGSLGKTEMWYVLDVDPGARIYAGFSHDITPETYDRHLATGEIMNDIARHTSQPGNIYFLPPGTIHAIGGGNFLIEIQQSSDITYRVFDYNRPDENGNLRPLHVEAARQAVDFSRCGDEVKCTQSEPVDGIATLVDCEYFRVKRVDITGPQTIDLSAIDSFVTLTCIDGTLTVAADHHPPITLRRGETAIIAASTAALTLTGPASLITATLPTR